MLRFEPLEPRCVPSRYTLTDLGSFHGREMNDWGLVAGVDAAGKPALWYGGQVTELPLPDGFISGGAQCVNALGQAAGYGLAADRSGHALFWDGHGVIDLGAGTIDGMNNLGQLAGFQDPNGPATVWEPDGSIQSFGQPYSVGVAINDAGQATGSDGGYRAFRWQNGVLTDLPATGFIPVVGEGIDVAGDVVGHEERNGPQGEYTQAVVWPAAGGLFTLDLPSGFISAAAYGINDKGRVVGTMSTGSVGHAFLWDRAHGIRDLNGLTDRGDFVLIEATRVANSGLIIASAIPPGGGPDHSVILTPVPDQVPAWLGWALNPHHHEKIVGA